MFKLLSRVLFTLVALLRVKSYESRPIVNGYSRFNRSTTLGRNTNFNGLIVYGKGEVLIGDNFHSGIGCKIITQSHNYNGGSVPYDATYKKYSICIENNVWIGMHVMIIGNVTIGEGAIIQAGSVVVSNIPSFSIAGGNPAKVFSARNIDKYALLVHENKFF